MAEFVRQPSPVEEPEAGGFDFVGYLCRRSWLGIFFGLIGAAAGYYYYLQQPVRYRAFSDVLVIKQQADLPVSSVNGYDPAGQRDPLANDARMIMSEGTVRPAIEAGRLHELPSLTKSFNPVQSIMQGLTVNRTSLQEDILQISYRGSDPEDCARIVNAVVNSYDKQLKNAYRDVGAVTENLLTSAKEEWQQRLKSSEDEYAVFRRSTSLLYHGDSVTSVSQSRMTEIESERSKVLIARTDVQSQLDSIQKAIDRGGSREAVLLMVEAFTQHDDKNTTPIMQGPAPESARELFALTLEEAILLEDVGPDHPTVKRVRKRIELTREFMREQSQAQGDTGLAESGDQDFLAVYIEFLQQQLQAGDDRLKQLNALFELEMEASQKQTDLQIRDGQLKAEIARSQHAFNSIFDRLKEVNLATKGGQYRTEVLSPAIRGVQVEPNFSKLITLGTALGMLAGLLLGLLVESADQSFRSPDEISQALRLPLVGAAPQIQFGRRILSSDFEPALITIHRPRSQSAEAFRGVRTHLLAASKGEGHKIVLISSPEPGDGKSTISSNLAVTLAQSGKSVLLIDADMRRPTVHKLFGLPREAGLSDLLEEHAYDIDDILKTVTFDGGTLTVMTSGDCPHDPGERLMSSQFENMIGMLRDKFEWIIIDSPPVLAVTDSAILSRFADGVVLVVRMNGRSRMAAVRAVETLRSLGAHLVGVVANGIDATKHNGYGYQYGLYGAGARAAKYYAESSESR